MKRNTILATLTMMVFLATLPALSLAEGSFGAAAVTAGQTYTLTQMLTYAMQDEYLAKAEYDVITSTFGDNAPFTNIARAEVAHQTLLSPLFDTYNVTIPENTAASQVVVPATVQDAYAEGVAVETANIAMYNTFLAQTDLPEDVRSTFVTLSTASQKHLAAFTRNAEKTGLGIRKGRGNGMMQNGTANANASTNTVCPTCGLRVGRNNRQGGYCLNRK